MVVVGHPGPPLDGPATAQPVCARGGLLRTTPVRSRWCHPQMSARRGGHSGHRFFLSFRILASASFFFRCATP